jgi:hypothetical protein
MIALPKLVLLVVVGFVVWYATRWWNRAPPSIMRRRQPSSPQPAIQDLVACRVCGAYAAADAGGCGKPGCPQLR